jgi:lambda family phage minor tail protein L
MIHADVQKLELGALVTMYELDLTTIDPIGGYVQRFCTQTLEGGDPVVFQGNEYQLMPLKVTGFESNSQGRIPKPRMQVNAIGGLVQQIAETFGDLVGAKITRRRTFEEYLDGGDLEDPLAEFPIDVYYIDRKVRSNKFMLEYELAAIHDLEETQLPRRIILSDACGHAYLGEECQWVQTPSYYFDEFGTSVPGVGDDACGKRLSDCRIRWEGRDGEGTPLTFGGHPGVQRLAR